MTSYDHGLNCTQVHYLRPQSVSYDLDRTAIDCWRTTQYNRRLLGVLNGMSWLSKQ